LSDSNFSDFIPNEDLKRFIQKEFGKKGSNEAPANRQDFDSDPNDPYEDYP